MPARIAAIHNVNEKRSFCDYFFIQIERKRYYLERLYLKFIIVRLPDVQRPPERFICSVLY
jgi:hypothetical protein